MKKEQHNTTIICIDDEDSVRDTYQRILAPAVDDALVEILSLAQARRQHSGAAVQAGHRFNVLLAASGEAAIEMIAREMDQGRRVAAGFFDMRMPGGMDGFETIKKVRQLDKDLLCCVVTAYTDRQVEEIRSLFTDEHQDELIYIKKPFSADELDQTALNMVCAWNRKRRLEEHVRAIEKQRTGLRQILHAVSTLSRVPPHSMEHLISGLLFQFLGMVEGEDGFAVVFSQNASESLHFKIGKYENTADLDQALYSVPQFKDAFAQNRVMVDGGSCSIPFLNGDRRLGGMYIESSHAVLHYMDHELLEIFKNQMVNLLLNSIYHSEMVAKERDSFTDPLTGLYNRRYINQRFREELNRSRRSQNPIAVIMIDIDDFKKINDTYGHDAGDSILKTVANLMRLEVRDYDLVGRNVHVVGAESQFAVRYGGEEFSLVLLDTDRHGAVAVGERLRKSIEDHVFRYEGREIALTVSVGIFSGDVYEELTDEATLLAEVSKKADIALYQAKAQGKNQVVVYSPHTMGTPESSVAVAHGV